MKQNNIIIELGHDVQVAVQVDKILELLEDIKIETRDVEYLGRDYIKKRMIEIRGIVDTIREIIYKANRDR
jgi:hypothetical protein